MLYNFDILYKVRAFVTVLYCKIVNGTLITQLYSQLHLHKVHTQIMAFDYHWQSILIGPWFSIYIHVPFTIRHFDPYKHNAVSDQVLHSSLTECTLRT